MQDKRLFEYATIRLVPRVEREEFINAGVILYCKDFAFLRCLVAVDKEKIQSLCANLDCPEIEEHLHSFQRICNGDPRGGPIAALDIASRFRWLTATRSTIVQTSRVHPGFCQDPEETLHKLYGQLVL